ncbi:hypothetical protein DTO021D3_3840 [Paecilomyces variotii]|nr:hypothetical protein DTO032I3_7945 [Paecilomyces variotii]KAJ9279384.1 hypothetical protein DTO021D3_3840 [Paecilomyces variotii]KAJ9341229.1 hypothetical protein DTO027B6_6210 [Paecilomyces variotii]KAJ9349358.1 hypothetical protein DTO027B9_7632 [Paecilomyces variotii]KAJ9380552.1 hypothetical protein DTO032I4_6640 [Paecilomyces variotii]
MMPQIKIILRVIRVWRLTKIGLTLLKYSHRAYVVRLINQPDASVTESITSLFPDWRRDLLRFFSVVSRTRQVIQTLIK